MDSDCDDTPQFMHVLVLASKQNQKYTIFTIVLHIFNALHHSHH